VKDRAYEQVVAALLRLGCEKLEPEGPWTVTVVRGAMIIQHVPKTPTVPPAVQRRIIRALGFTEAEYLRELAKPS
jgi:hypothetical protein